LGKNIIFGTAALGLAAASAAATAQDTQDILVVAPGLPGLNPTALPAASDSLGTADLRRGGTTSLLRSLDTDLPGVTLDDAQGNPYQPNLLYHGYEASPLGGNPQGLATYVDGARFNQPFGDATNWELLPDIAIDKVTVEGSNPVYGLNALGGAVAVTLKSGRSFRGLGGEAAIGRFGKRQIAAEAGYHRNGWSAYLAGSIQHDDGWRDFSPSTVHQTYGQIGADGTWGTVDLRLMGAETRLTGNGTAPVELLAVRRKSIFTWPDRTENRYGRALLTAELRLSHHLRLRPSAYVQRFRQNTVNGDLSDAEPCESNGAILCLNGGEGVVTDSNGAPFAAFNGEDGYAQLNRTRTHTTGYGAAFQLDDDAPLAAMTNRLAIGLSWDGSRSRFAASSLLGALTENRGFGDPQGVIDMADGPIRNVSLLTRRNDVGLYAADVLSPLHNLDVTVAARYNHASIRLSDQLGTDLNGRHRYARLNPSAGLVWRIRPHVSLYAGYAEANRAPTPAELSCANETAPCSLTAFFVQDPHLRQVVSHTVEAGFRGNGRLGEFMLDWRLGGWRATNTNDILFAASATRGRAFFRNVGGTRRQGLEGEIEAKRGPWELHLSYVLTDATFRTAFRLASPDNPKADDDGTIAVRPGDQLPGIPRHRLKASVTRHFGERAWLSLDEQYSSGRWLQGDEANLTHRTAAYWLTNLSAGVTPVRGLEFFAEVRNLFDRKYATFGTFSETSVVDFAEAPGITNPCALSPGAPRTWFIGARARF
jgi:outer membrane receptor protein involved in Fe transport